MGNIAPGAAPMGVNLLSRHIHNIIYTLLWSIKSTRIWYGHSILPFGGDSGVNLVWKLGGRGSGSTQFWFFKAHFREIL